MMPTSVTMGKSNPFATICVPRRKSVCPVRKAPRIEAAAPRFRVASKSSLARRASGKHRATSRSMRWIPTPPNQRLVAPQSGHPGVSFRPAPQ